jgi:hypothetical protein
VVDVLDIAVQAEDPEDGVAPVHVSSFVLIAIDIVGEDDMSTRIKGHTALVR